MAGLSELTPHGFCLAWQPGLLWLHAVSDLLTAVAYYSIPLALLCLVRRRPDLAFPWVFRLFAAFIVACGTTHLLAVVTLWEPFYLLDGLLKAATAVISVATAVALWPLLPHVIALPSPAALRESEARQRALYRSTPAALHTIDAQGRLTKVSDQWLAQFGYERNEVIGSLITSFYVGPVDVDGSAEWELLLRDGTVRDVERRIRCRDGSIRDVLVSATLERDAAGALRQVPCAVVDVTAGREAEAALRGSEERLRQAQKMEAVGQLTGGIAHDFNNTLTAVIGSLELLRRRVPEEPRIVQLLDGAMAASNRAARLTSQLLSFSRLQRLEPQTLDPLEVIGAMQELLARTLGERVALRVNPAEASLLCVADRNQLESALLNLILNARAAIDGPGEVRIRLRAVHLDEADTTVRADEVLPVGDYVAITVADDGCGMTEEVRRRAIEPFFTTKGVGQGSGLGLSQTYGFLRQSGGTLLIDSKPGAGTRIDMLLPRASASILDMPPARQDLVGGDERPGRGERVLVVEDEPVLLGLVTAALLDGGYDVIGAENGDTALAIIRSDPSVRLVFTDMVMPGRLNGADLAREARGLRPELPILFASGYSQAALLERWPEPAVMLAKPYAMAQVTRKIASALQGSVLGKAAAD